LGCVSLNLFFKDLGLGGKFVPVAFHEGELRDTEKEEEGLGGI